MIESEKYLDKLKVIELGAEGGSEALYRLLPYGSANFIWRTYGNGIGENEAGEEVWEDHSDEYEDISEYLIQRTPSLAGLYPEHVDVGFRDQVFKALVDSFREPGMHHMQRLFGEPNAHGWSRWQNLLQLRASYDEVVIHSAFGMNPIRKICLDYDSVKTVRQMLNTVYLSLLHTFIPTRAYGRLWRLYDIVNCREFVLPHDDRDDRLYDAGITQGGQWMVYGGGDWAP